MKRTLLAQALAAIGLILLVLIVASSCGTPCPTETLVELAMKRTQVAQQETRLAELETDVAGLQTQVAEPPVCPTEPSAVEPSPPTPPTVPPTVSPTVPPSVTRTDTGVIACEDAGKHIGEYACVCCGIVRTYYCSGCGGQPTFLNSHDPYEGHFTVVAWGENRQAFVQHFGGGPESVFRNRFSCFYGLIEWYAPNQAPEIVLRDPSNACMNCTTCP